MAQKKKGKKPAGNPARGFATVSVSSKPKASLDEIKEADDVTAVQSQVDTPNNVEQKFAQGVQETGQKDKELPTPAELERQLREDELQLLIEKNGDQIKKEALRTATRLKTDRRLLRGQSETVNLRLWLPEELQHAILELNRQENITTKGVYVASQWISESLGVSDEGLLKLWQLRRVLETLDFVSKDVSAALQALVESPEARQDDAFKKSSSGTPGLEQCLVWLGLNRSIDQLPDYFTFQNAAMARAAHENAAEQEKRLHEKLQSDPTRRAKEPVRHDPSDEEEEVEDFSSDDEPFDRDDPEQLQVRYIKLMTRLFKLRPDLTDVSQLGKKKKKQTSQLTRPVSETPRVQRIREQMKSIESDMLFDRDSAQTIWASKRQDLLMDALPRKRSRVQNSAPANTTGDAPMTETALNKLQDVEDETLGLEGLMGALNTGEAPLPEAETPITYKQVPIRTFGKWTGTGPRRILEDTCKSRDSGVQVTFRIHNQTSGVRHALEITWTTPQDLEADCPVSEVILAATPLQIHVSMEDIGASDTAQSEAYISTVTLFSIFSASAKEEKAYTRLPTVWRNLYIELRDLMKLKVEATDRSELAEIRAMAEASIVPDVDIHDGTQLQTKLETTSKDASVSRTIATVEQEDHHDPQQVQEIWKRKSSTPAYIDMEKTRSNLPMWSFKKEIVSAICNNQVVIICGETGCGKSTQTPNFILENELSQGRHCKIYVTEPRRISAISLAQRVSQEIGEARGDLGTKRSLVGYSIRLESKVVSSTCLVYATTGVVMRIIERDPGLSDITHLILDEVHERTIDSDFLLIILRRLLVRRPELKVILMSATVNAERFSAYLHGAPVFNVPGRTFPVEVCFLEDAIEATKYGSSDVRTSGKSLMLNAMDDDDRVSSDEEIRNGVGSTDLSTYSIATRNALKEYNEYRTNYDLIVKLLETLAKESKYREYSRAILVFLPGINEIRRLNDALSGHPLFSRDWQIFPLHSTIAIEEQERAFRIPPRGVRKIVLATNIAETGITIPDITCVVDTGTHKEMRYDERRQLSRLIEAFISKANAKQRRGRAGRVQNGLCFHLFTRDRHDRLMAAQQTPEIMRLSLQDLVLRVKICELGEIEATLSEALDAPLAKNVRRAVDHLIDVKALTSDERLTHLGRQLSKLPLDVFLGKLLLLGSIYKTLDSCLSFAAILSSRSPFAAAMGAKSQADQVRLGFKKADSDLVTVYNAYCGWRRVCQTPGVSESDFCRRNFLSSITLSNIEELKAQLTNALMDAGFISPTSELKASLSRVRSHSRQRHFVEIPDEYTANDKSDVVVNSVIAWSFYPKLITRDGKGWRSVTSNQPVVLHPTSVNKTGFNGRFLSYYHLMQSAGKSYNAHETTAVEDFAIALACGDADFKLYAGVVAIDSNRLRLAMPSWKSIIALKYLRKHVLEILEQKFRNPGKPLSQSQEKWLQLWQRCFDERNAISSGR